jgi:prepilin-type N-terminal cleavage/methylation domain-containing protein
MPINAGSRSRGFTLVEMSIVLVIIGLIIGGILKGQEIIASARQKAVINQVNAVRAATNTYFDRYRALPGDDPNATNIDASLTFNGDGNGRVINTASIASAGALGNDTNGNSGEQYAFFNDLIAANLLNGGQVTTAANGSNFGVSALPAAPISGAGMTVVYGTHGGAGTASAKTTHWVRIHKNVKTPGFAISPRTLANIDAQIDDGIPQQGGVRGDTTSTCDNGTATYLAKDDLGCVPLFEVAQ